MKDFERREKLAKKKAFAKKEKHGYDPVPMKPCFRTLNGYFVKEGETFPLCGFPESWICFITKEKVPRLRNLL